jgi:hypothetical protein
MERTHERVAPTHDVETHQRVLQRLLQLHEPFERVWRRRSRLPVKKEFHSHPNCPRLGTLGEVRTGRLGSLTQALWLPCRRCYPTIYEGMPHA